MSATLNKDRVREILATIKPLAAEYYRLTGKPLGVTGEVAEYVAAEVLGLDLAPARMAGYDATRTRPDGTVERIQIKGRATGATSKAIQRLGTLKRDAACDVALFVLTGIFIATFFMRLSSPCLWLAISPAQRFRARLRCSARLPLPPAPAPRSRRK